MSETEFVVESTKLSLTIAGQKYVGRFPFRREVREYQAALKTQKPEEAGEFADKFLVSLGFPQEALDEMSAVKYLEFLSLAISGSKKN